MSRAFAATVKAQGVDRKSPNRRGLTGRALFALAHSARTRAMRQPIELTTWQKLARFVRRCIRRVV